MPITQTDRLGLPLLAAGQAQKELAHNEALLLLDIASQPVAQSADLTVPPASPELGQCWIVAPSATGDWSGMDGALGGWTGSGWRFAAPSAGWRAWVVDRGRTMRFDGSGWVDENVRDDGYFVAGERVLAVRQAAIASPSGGATVDSEARSALGAILAMLRAHGLIES
ncbi:MAG: DUF2793 domain-containing protein [Sphingobium sp.]|nr:DUF2793 domain-containing protein [Sphingobium sp.]